VSLVELGSMEAAVELGLGWRERKEAGKYI
jgi:hypothetical protein